MTFREAIDLYVADQRQAGRINSEATDRSYRATLDLHAQDVGNRDPRTIGRDEVKRTLTRWPHPNTQRARRAALVSFYRWTVEEGIRANNPAEQTRRPKARPTSVYRLTRGEAIAMLNACETEQETRAIHLGLCAGLRSAELRGLRVEHLLRPGFVWVSAEIGKGGRERFIPIIEELEPIIADILDTSSALDYVLTATRWVDPPFNTQRRKIPGQPMAPKPLWELVGRVGKRAGLVAHVHPHLLRHAFGDHVARHGGIELARAMLGHADVRTTKAYVGDATLDQLTIAVHGLRYDRTTASPEPTPSPTTQSAQ
jgi:site-specific recombinase XerD